MRFIVSLGLLLTALSGCNTVSGIGKDISAVGSGITGASTYVQNNMFARREPVRAVQATSALRPASITFRERARVNVGTACDPSAELSGGSGLPPCPRSTVTSRAPTKAPPQRR